MGRESNSSFGVSPQLLNIFLSVEHFVRSLSYPPLTVPRCLSVVLPRPVCSGLLQTPKLDHPKGLRNSLALVNVFMKLEKHCVPVQIILRSVPGKGRPFLVKYVRVHGNRLSPQALLNALTIT